ncbi:hypothetical protein CKM354_000665900 [Cercospora kikuchii]|uniref:F-box domain-containing protein n=1 Tax=Cercospora kikuchii TaxID=84275 RepID=A0A9P3CJS9_9PEZI|nr:uncharacterized protein CKM354_000665900 [Cercospora kikuchii]GIZ43431.1 hypothetical protein CKM354_000665900 [Cercospora kikuchii]
MAVSHNAGASKPRDVFAFFDLPRELRDMIYEAAVEDRSQPGSKTQPTLRAKRVPLPQLLQVSRRFSDEYREHIGGSSSLHLSDHVDFQLANVGSSIGIPTAARKIRTLHIRLASFDGEELSEELELHEKWAALALQTLPDLQELTFRLDVCTTEDATGATDLLSKPVWSTLPHLSRLEIWLREATMDELNGVDSESHTICNKLLVEDDVEHQLFATWSLTEKAFVLTDT